MESISHKHEFSPDEIRKMNVKIVDLLGLHKKLIEEKKTITKELTDKIKKTFTETMVLQENLENGFETRHTDCEPEPNYDLEVLNWKDSDGNIIHSEPLPEEYRQTTIDDADDNQADES